MIVHDQGEEKSNEKTQMKRQRVWWPFIITPYIIGIVWHGLHPSASIFTGEFTKARGWYIDENSLDPHHFLMNEKYSPLKKSTPAKSRVVSSLCDALKKKRDRLLCRRIIVRTSEASDSVPLEIARIVPVANAVAPVNEAIVIVIPPSENWYSSQFHYSILQLIHRLSTPSVTPWLAKTIMIVTTSSTKFTLHQTVDSFLYLYLESTDALINEDDFYRYTGAVLRTLLVVDSTESNTSVTNELRVLPQGQRGLLPNMDLVFLCTTAFARTNMVREGHVTVTLHQYESRIEALKKSMKPRFPTSWHSWFDKMLSLLAFELTLFKGPILPHSFALDHGIDAISIELSSLGQNNTQDYQLQLVAKIEPILRALSNLYERLHHSTSLYLLPSPETFVKHEEYLVSTLLLILPLAIRAITLLLFDIDHFQWSAVQRALSITLLASAIFSLSVVSLKHQLTTHAINQSWDKLGVAAIYLTLILYLIKASRASCFHTFLSRSALQSVQCSVCLFALYIHVPIAFGHVALACPSALFWSPLLSFPSFRHISDNSLFRATESADSMNTVGSSRHILIRLLKVASIFARISVLLATSTQVVVPGIIPTYTSYVCYTYIPLHSLLTYLWFSEIIAVFRG